MSTESPSPRQNVTALLNDEVRIDPAGIAQLLGASRGYVYKLRKTDPRFPAPVESSNNRTRWRLADVRAYLASQQPQGVQQ